MDHAPDRISYGELWHHSSEACTPLLTLGDSNSLRFGGWKMSNETRNEIRPLSWCEPCSERTPHRYERVGVDGQLKSRAICLVCNNDSRSESARQSLNGKLTAAPVVQPAASMRRRPHVRFLRRRSRRISVDIHEQP